MERQYYRAETLERVLSNFEERYGLTSEEFYAAHVADDPLPAIRGFDRHVWASFYRDARRLRGDFFAEHTREVLTH